MKFNLLEGPYIKCEEYWDSVYWVHMNEYGCLFKFEASRRGTNPFDGGVAIERPTAWKAQPESMYKWGPVPAAPMPSEAEARLYLDWCLHQINEVGLKLEKEVTIMEGVAGEQVELFFDRATEHYNIFKCRVDGEHPIVYLNKEASEGLDSVFVVWDKKREPTGSVAPVYTLKRISGNVYRDEDGQELRWALAPPLPPDHIQVSIFAVDMCPLCDRPLRKGDRISLFGLPSRKAEYHRSCFEGAAEALIK